MRPYDVDTDHLAGTVEEMAAVEAELRDLATRLTGSTARLHGTWDGRAAGAHAVAQHRWDDGLATMHAALTRMRGAARTAHDNYTRAAETNVRMWTLG